MATRSRTTIIGSGSPMIAYAEGASGSGGGIESIYSFIATGSETEINIYNTAGSYFVADSAKILLEGYRWLRRKTALTTVLGNWEFEEIANGVGQHYIVRLKSGVVFNPNENVDIFYTPSSS